MKPSSAKKPSIWPATPWMLSWPPTMMKPATLLRISTWLRIVIGVLHAVEPLGHLEIERGGGAPADRRGDDDGVGPVHQRLVDLIHLVRRIHLRDGAGPGAGARRLRVVALAGAELQRAEPDQPRLARRAAAAAAIAWPSRWSEPEKRGLASSIAVVEMPASRSGPGARSILRDSGCGVVRLSRALGRRRDVDQDAAVLDLHRVGGNRVLLEARLALAGAAVEFPVVPGADDVVAVEPALAERAADVVAGVRHRAELPVLERQREIAAADREMPQRRRR